MIYPFTPLQVVYMGVCVYTPAFALNAGKKCSCILLATQVDLNIDDLCDQCVAVFSFSHWIWIVGFSAGYWTSVHIVHNNGELLTVFFRLNFASPTHPFGFLVS